MFKVGDVVRVKVEEQSKYHKRNLSQPFQILDITSMNEYTFSHICALKGLKDNCREFLFTHKLEMDISQTRKIKLEKICSKLEI